MLAKNDFVNNETEFKEKHKKHFFRKRSHFPFQKEMEEIGLEFGIKDFDLEKMRLKKDIQA